MSCCWRPSAQQQTVIRVDGTTTPKPNGHGVVELQAHPDCTRPHRGEYRARVVYIVAYGTEHEKLFRHDDAKAAVAYRASIGRKTHLDQFPGEQICHQAVMDLYDQ